MRQYKIAQLDNKAKRLLLCFPSHTLDVRQRKRKDHDLFYRKTITNINEFIKYNKK